MKRASLGWAALLIAPSCAGVPEREGASARSAPPPAARPDAGDAPSPPPRGRIAVGARHACAILPSGGVTCWGNDDAGQLGDGARGAQAAPVEVPGVAGAVQIDAGDDRTCAVTQAGQVICWGGPDARPRVAPEGAGAIQVSVSGRRACAVLGTGAVRCWGEGWLGDGRSAQRAGSVGLVAGVDDAVEVRGSCVLRRSGEVWCWGSNGSGEIGDGTTESRSAPVPVRDLHDAIAIAAGDAHACALRRGGEAICWGAANLGQLGDGRDQPRRLVPGPVAGVDDAVSLTARGLDTCVVRRGGAVACWGGQTYGALPEGHPGVTLPVGAAPSIRPAAVAGLADAVEVVAGPGHACARRASGGVACWGDNADGQLGGGVAGRSGKLSAVGGIADAVRVAHGGGFVCALRASGEVACWGDGTAGQLGDGTRRSRGSPVHVDLPARAEAISVSSEHACAVTSPGGITCWGSGVPAPVAGEAPEAAQPSPVTALSDAIEVATSASHTCARRRGGQVACWGGDSDLGQLGARIAGGSPHGPVTVGIPGQATGIATTDMGGCAWGRDGRLVCWGAGSITAWAPGPPGSRRPPLAATVAPRAVPGLDGVAGAGARDGTMCALQRTGRVRCWSSNGFSLLPDAPLPPSAEVPGVADGARIHDLLVIRATGELLAVDPATRAAVAVAPGLGDVIDASGGLDAGCAVRRGGTVACWGDDTFGQLGAGASARSAQPIAVVGLTAAGN